MFCVRDLILAYCTTNAFALLLSVILSLLLWHVMIWNLLALVFPSRARMSFYVLVQLLRRSISSTCSLHNLSFLSLIMSFTSWQHKSTPVCGLSCFSLIYFFTYLVNWFLETGLDLLIVFLGMSLFAAFLPLLVCDTARAVPFVLLMMHFLLVFRGVTAQFDLSLLLITHKKLSLNSSFFCVHCPELDPSVTEKFCLRGLEDLWCLMFVRSLGIFTLVVSPKLFVVCSSLALRTIYGGICCMMYTVLVWVLLLM